MNSKIATPDSLASSRLGDVVTITLYAFGIGAGAIMGLMGVLLVA